MSETLIFTGTLVTDSCWCGIRHAVPSELKDKQRRDWEAGVRQEAIFCPLGHQYIISGESPLKAERVKQLRLQVQAERDLHKHTSDRLRAQKGATTKAKKRHAAGVCPCCSRSFKQLRRHMASQHPEFLQEHGLPVGAGS